MPPDLERDYLEFDAAITAGFGPGAGVGAGSFSPATPEARSQLKRFGRLVHDSSASLALISDGDRRLVYTRHVLDSLNPLSLFTTIPASVLDVGSGAGFPGIPLAIVWPDTTVVLLESREKKAGFLERAARELGLKNVHVVCGRLEDHVSDWRVGPVEAVFVRAVADVPFLLEHAAGRTTPGATWVYFLGAGTDAQPLVASLRAGGIAARVEPGAFGGRLLTGAFAGS